MLNLEGHNNKELNKVKVINLQMISNDLFVLTMDFRSRFTPGQVISLSVSNEIPPRLYSIANGINDKHFKILFNIKDSGVLTPLLAKLNSGDIVYISNPFGEFTSVEDEAIWIATGTGIAPFLSMSLSGNYNNKTLIHGARFKSSFYFQDNFNKLLGENYIKCCSKESGDDLYSGRVSDFLNNKNDLPLNSMYYLCGRAEMIVEVRDILIKKGISFNKIIAEIYF